MAREACPAKNGHQISRHSNDGQLADYHQEPLRRQQKPQVEALRDPGKNEPPKNPQHPEHKRMAVNILGLTLINAKPCTPKASEAMMRTTTAGHQRIPLYLDVVTSEP